MILSNFVSALKNSFIILALGVFQTIPTVWCPPLYRRMFFDQI